MLQGLVGAEGDGVGVSQLNERLDRLVGVLPLLIGECHLIQGLRTGAIVLRLVEEAAIIVDGRLVIVHAAGGEGQVLQGLELQGERRCQAQHVCELLAGFLIPLQLHEGIPDVEVDVVGDGGLLASIFLVCRDGFIPPVQSLVGRGQAEGGKTVAFVVRIELPELLKRFHRLCVVLNQQIHLAQVIEGLAGGGAVRLCRENGLINDHGRFVVAVPLMGQAGL